MPSVLQTRTPCTFVRMSLHGVSISRWPFRRHGQWGSSYRLTATIRGRCAIQPSASSSAKAFHMPMNPVPLRSIEDHIGNSHRVGRRVRAHRLLALDAIGSSASTWNQPIFAHPSATRRLQSSVAVARLDLGAVKGDLADGDLAEVLWQNTIASMPRAGSRRLARHHRSQLSASRSDGRRRISPWRLRTGETPRLERPVGTRPSSSRAAPAARPAAGRERGRAV